MKTEDGPCTFAVKTFPIHVDGAAALYRTERSFFTLPLISHVNVLGMIEGSFRWPEPGNHLVLEHCDLGDLVDFMKSNSSSRF